MMHHLILGAPLDALLALAAIVVAVGWLVWQLYRLDHTLAHPPYESGAIATDGSESDARTPADLADPDPLC